MALRVGAAGIRPGGAPYGVPAAGSAGDPCTTAVVKPTLVKAVCRGPGVTVSPPFAGELGVVLTAGTASKHYCGLFGGRTSRNTFEGLVRRAAPAPTACPVVPPP